MSDAIAAAPAPVASEEIAAAPAPISVEPRVAPPAEAAEIARQTEEAKLPKPAAKEEAKAVDKKEPVRSTKEALRAAREKVEAEPASPLKNDPKAAESVAAKTDSKEAPAAKAEVAKAAEPIKAEPVRAADGKFVSADPAKAVEAAAKPKIESGTEPAKATLPSFTAEPPPKRFSKEAQDEWAAAPEKVRAEVSRMEKELTAGFEKHRTDATAYQGYRELDDIAKSHGHKSGADVFRGYYEMENALRNPETREKAFEGLFQKLGVSPREWAEKVLNQAPDAVAGKAEAANIELRNQNAALEKRLAALEGAHTQQKTDSTTEAVTKFAADHPRFEELSEDIAFFLKTKHPGDLAKAYEAAERLNPAPAASKPEPVVTAPAASSAASATVIPIAPAASSAAAAKSIAGAPTAGSDPARKQPSPTIKEALRRAQQRAG